MLSRRLQLMRLTLRYRLEGKEIWISAECPGEHCRSIIKTASKENKGFPYFKAEKDWLPISHTIKHINQIRAKSPKK